MPIEQLEQMSKRDVVSVLRNVHNLCCYAGILTDEFCLRLERTRLDIAFRWLQTDSLERKVTGMKEYKDFIDSTKRKYEAMQKNELQPTNRTYSRVRGSMQIFFIDFTHVLKHLNDKNILEYTLAEDVHEELVARSYEIMEFLALNGCLKRQHIDLLWQHLSTGHESVKVSVIILAHASFFYVLFELLFFFRQTK